jgi:hypothetical protein
MGKDIGTAATGVPPIREIEKSEIRISKQIQNPNSQNPLRKSFPELGHLNLFRASRFVLRIWTNPAR